MSTDATKAADFKSVCSFNPAKNTVSDSELKRITPVISSVIDRLQTTDQELDSDAIATFSEKIGQINSKLKDEGKGTPFTVALYTMSLLTDLKNSPIPRKPSSLGRPLCR